MNVKKERILHITLLLLLLSPPPAESFIFTAIITAVSFAYQAYQMINDAHDTYKKFAPQTTLDDVLDQAKRVEEKVDQIGAQLSNQIGQAVDTIVTRIDDMNNIREKLGKLSGGIRRIDSLYRLFELYTTKRIRLNNHTLQDYIHQVTTTGAFGPKDILDEIHELIIPSSGFDESLLYYINKDTPSNDTNLCDNDSPAQGRLYQIFRLIMVNEIRVFTMLSFSYALNQAFRCESFEGEIELADLDLRTRAMDYYDVFSELTERTVNSLRRCDPAEGWIRGENFYEFERFKSDFIVSARAFYSENEDCEGCPESRTMIKECDSDYGCFVNSTCRGTISACYEFIASAEVCELQPPEPRYKYIRTIGGERWGADDSKGCEAGTKYLLREENNCDVCWCKCVEDSYRSYSVRTFSIREQLSDVANNKVVTGVRFVMMENILHLQIQEGTVLPEGRIVPNSAEWKDLENIKFDEEKTLNEGKLVYYISSDDAGRYEMEEGKDYISFDYKNSLLYLDDLKVPPGYVITGAKLSTEIVDANKGRPMRLAIRASPYEYDSGEMKITDDNPSVWLTSDDMVGQIPDYDKDREYMFLYQATTPLVFTDEVAVPRSSPNSLMVITNTGVQADVGQSTIPFFDAQEVTGRPSFAAGGIGLYYKSISTYVGGFVGLRLWGLEPMKNMQISVLNKLDEFKKDVTEFQGCNDEIQA